MPDIRAEVSATIGAPPVVVYGIIADYRTGHPRILPPRFFQDLRVVSGGVGAGTRITFAMIAFGKRSQLDAEVSEPEPGRLLHEYYPATDMLTTFTVEPHGERSEVTITTQYTKAGLNGWIESLLVPGYLKKVFTEELGLLDRVAREVAATR